MHFDLVLRFVFAVAILLVAVTVHEFAHGWVAFIFGDDTAKRMGRLTLNPLRHIDPMWTVFYPFLIWVASGFRFTFGMAKPVPVDFTRLRQPKQHMVLVALAGPAANLLFAYVLGWMVHLFPVESLISQAVHWLIYLNIILAVFNLFPIPPLDGGRVVVGLLPNGLARVYAQLEPFGILIVLGLLITGWVGRLLIPIVNAVCRFIGVPPLA